MAKEIVGSVSVMWRFPVKSMSGERLDRVDVTDRGLIGDRGYALIDAETGKVVSAKSVRLFPDMFACQAAFVEPPQPDRELPPVRIALPNGASVASDSGKADGVLSEFFKREVRLARAAPEGFTIDQYHPDLGELQSEGPRDTVVDQKLGSAFFAEAGLASPVPTGAFFDLFPITILSTSTLDQLQELRPASVFDQRRFRMNLIVQSKKRGFVENGWVGRELQIGESVQLSIAVPDPRCVMTTLAQDDLPKDIEILRTLARHNKIQVGTFGQLPCAGVYAVVMKPGSLRTGDQVTVN